jgi:hypothetical protein
MSYLLVVAAAAGGAFVVPASFEPPPSPQPVSTAPANKLKRTNTMYVLFIVGITFTKGAKMASTIFKIVIGLSPSTPKYREAVGGTARENLPSQSEIATKRSPADTM